MPSCTHSLVTLSSWVGESQRELEKLGRPFTYVIWLAEVFPGQFFKIEHINLKKKESIFLSQSQLHKNVSEHHPHARQYRFHPQWLKEKDLSKHEKGTLYSSSWFFQGTKLYHTCTGDSLVPVTLSSSLPRSMLSHWGFLCLFFFFFNLRMWRSR